MYEYSDVYLEKNFDNFVFFDPDCIDRRARGINIKQSRCLKCPGLEKCKTHPLYWAEGEKERQKVDAKLKKARA